MAETLDPKLIDKRIAERNLRKGLLDEKTYERHIKGLPDLAEKAVPIESTMSDEDEDFEDDDETDDDEGAAEA